MSDLTLDEALEAIGASGELDDEFWDARPTLKHIRMAAHARQRSAPAVLGVVLARVAAMADHRLRIPPIVGTDAGLALITIVLANPGVGKSTAAYLAGELAPGPPEPADGAPGYLADNLPVGTGEGMAEVYFGIEEETDSKGKVTRIKRQVRHNAFFLIDEGQVLGEIGNRKGATLLPTIRSAFTGATIGQTNASEDRKRVLKAGTYSLGMVVALQTILAGPLLDDAAGGTPQRCLWLPATDPTIPDCPPAWPGALPVWWRSPERLSGVDADGYADMRVPPIEVAEEVAEEVRAADLARVRGQVVTDPLQAHHDLLRLKVAAALAMLDGRFGITMEDWQLATVIKAHSDLVRTSVAEAVKQEAVQREAQQSTRMARRAAHADAFVAQRRTVDAARWVAKKVWDQPERWTVSHLRRAIDARKRDVFNDALESAVAEGWVVVAQQEGQGADKRTVRPGPQRWV